MPAHIKFKQELFSGLTTPSSAYTSVFVGKTAGTPSYNQGNISARLADGKLYRVPYLEEDLTYATGKEFKGNVDIAKDLTVYGTLNWSGSSSDTFVTGGTLSSSILTLTRNDGQNINIPGFHSQFTGNTSGDCIEQLWVASLSGCSPIKIGPIVVSEVNGKKSTFSPYGFTTLSYDSTGCMCEHDGCPAGEVCQACVCVGESETNVSSVALDSVKGVNMLDYIVSGNTTATTITSINAIRANLTQNIYEPTESFHFNKYEGVVGNGSTGAQHQSHASNLSMVFKTSSYDTNHYHNECDDIGGIVSTIHLDNASSDGLQIDYINENYTLTANKSLQAFQVYNILPVSGITASTTHSILKTPSKYEEGGVVTMDNATGVLSSTYNMSVSAGKVNYSLAAANHTIAGATHDVWYVWASDANDGATQRMKYEEVLLGGSVHSYLNSTTDANGVSQALKYTDIAGSITTQYEKNSSVGATGVESTYEANKTIEGSAFSYEVDSITQRTSIEANGTWTGIQYTKRDTIPPYEVIGTTNYNFTLDGRGHQQTTQTVSGSTTASTVIRTSSVEMSSYRPPLHLPLHLSLGTSFGCTTDGDCPDGKVCKNGICEVAASNYEAISVGATSFVDMGVQVTKSDSTSGATGSTLMTATFIGTTSNVEKWGGTIISTVMMSSNDDDKEKNCISEGTGCDCGSGCWGQSVGLCAGTCGSSSSVSNASIGLLDIYATSATTGTSKTILNSGHLLIEESSIAAGIIYETICVVGSTTGKGIPPMPEQLSPVIAVILQVDLTGATTGTTVVGPTESITQVKSPTHTSSFKFDSTSLNLHKSIPGLGQTHSALLKVPCGIGTPSSCTDSSTLTLQRISGTTSGTSVVGYSSLFLKKSVPGITHYASLETPCNDYDPVTAKLITGESLNCTDSSKLTIQRLSGTTSATTVITSNSILMTSADGVDTNSISITPDGINIINETDDFTSEMPRRFTTTIETVDVRLLGGPTTLIPEPGAGKMLNIMGITVGTETGEGGGVLTPYATSTDLHFIFEGADTPLFTSSQILLSTVPRRLGIPMDVESIVPTDTQIFEDTSFQIVTSDAINPTLGESRLHISILYQIIDALY